MTKLLFAAAAIAVSATAHAAITVAVDSSAFAYKYEMDTAPHGQDLDNNGTNDWFSTGVPSVSGGFATNTAGNQLFRGDFGGSLWRNIANSTTADWTLEVRVAKTGGTQGSNGWFGIATDPAGEANSGAIYLKDDRVVIEQGATDLEFLTGSFVASDYNTIRVAHDSVANSYYYWINGTLLNVDLATPIAPGNSDMSSAGSVFIGDYSSSISGDYSIDYIRVDGGAYAPVPEPSTYGLMGAGALAAAALVRRRLRRAGKVA